MIDLSHTRAGFLAELEAPRAAASAHTDLTDPLVASRDAHVLVCGHTRDELFPQLRMALSERFAMVPRPDLLRNLLAPLSHALGNAGKHGNGNDPAKNIVVELVLTRKGALVAVTDEGPGFDTALIFRRFQEQGNYFVNHGDGFRGLHQATSTISYENGGRTLLLCFQPSEAPALLVPSSAVLARPSASPSESPGPSTALDGASVQAYLSYQAPEFGENRARIESCRLYTTPARSSDECGHRYVIRLAPRHGGAAVPRILTGRIHATEAAAQTDFDSATRLREANLSRHLLIPRPVAHIAGPPPMVLYDFDPWMNLWEYLGARRNLDTLRHAAKNTGRMLACLHRSGVAVPNAESDRASMDLRELAARAEQDLQTAPLAPDLAKRLITALQGILEGTSATRPQTRTPIHGALGWDCIHYGTDGEFYLYRFEHCRWGDPRLDLGGFTADLLCFTLANHDEGEFRRSFETFFRRYNSRVADRISAEELRPYVLLALAARLRPPAPFSWSDREQWFTAWECASSPTDWARLSEAPGPAQS